MFFRLKYLMQIIKLSDVNFEDLANRLRNGELGIFPFDTCYGLVCDPTSQKAVDKLLSYKARREGKAISIAVDSLEMAKKYAEMGMSAKNFFRNFLPGPYTIINSSNYQFAIGIKAENSTIGIRIPDSQPVLNLVKAFGSPVTSTSANQSYQKTPYKVEDILDGASKKSLKYIDFIIDAGELQKNPPSTVIDMSNDQIHIIRKGSIIPEGAKTEEFISNSEEETIEYAHQLTERFSANLNFRPVLFALQGDMGAGKTHFTKGLAQSLGVRDRIQSPTFIISNEYSLQQGNKLYHIDTWRLELKDGFQELDDLEFEKMFEVNKYANPAKRDSHESSSSNKSSSQLFNVISIEWADKIQEYLHKLDLNLKIIWVEIVKDSQNENRRIIKFTE